MTRLHPCRACGERRVTLLRGGGLSEMVPAVASTKGFAHEPGLSHLWGNRSHLSGSGRR